MKTKILFLFWILFLLDVGPVFTQEEPPSEPQEEMIPEEAQQQQWTRAFAAAEAAFNSDSVASISLFEDLITQITEEKEKRALTNPEQVLLVRSLDYLGQALFTDDKQDRARIVFLKLIELNPNYQLNEDLVSPKIIRFVARIKDENLGILSITSEPTGATVKLDGMTLGNTDIPSLYSLKGDHDIEVSKPGFYTEKKTITVIPQKTQKLAFKLERSSSVAYLITYPKGVELILGGKRLGVTGGEPAERSVIVATEQNLPPQDFSAEFPLTDLQTGDYDVEFRKECWEPQTRRITIDKNQDYLIEPIVLSSSHAFLNITADDPQATIFIDNEYKGVAPKQKLQVCSGKHVVKLKGALGKFEKEISLKKDEVLEIAARMNPSLAFLGLVAAPDVLKSDLERLRSETAEQLSGLQNLNFVDNSNKSNFVVRDDVMRQIITGIDANKPDKDRRAMIQELCTKVESDLLLIGYVPKEKLQRIVQFYLLSNWSSMADVREVQVFDLVRWNQFKSQLEYEEPLFQKRLGVSLIDTAITSGPVVAQVLVKTFEETQPLMVGDVINSIGNKPAKSTAEIVATMKELQTQEQVNLNIDRDGAQNEITIKLLNSPMEIRFDNSAMLYNRQLVAFKKAINISTNPLEKSIALLNIGLVHMHFAEYDVAFDQLRQIQLNREFGIGQGTVQYRIAQCYRELGYRKEAQEALTEASRYAQNTIYSDDGPLLVNEIQRAQQSLQ